MLDSFVYETHLGQRFVGLENGVYLNYSDLRDYSWSYDKINDRISRFYRPITTKKIPLRVVCDTEAEANVVRNRLLDLAETDIEARRPGRVYIGDYYINGYITSSKKTKYLIDKRMCYIDLVLTTDIPAWYCEKAYSFAQSGETGNAYTGGTEYPFDYPFDFSVRLTNRDIVCDTIRPNAFRLLIYGPANNPEVVIGGHKYVVNGEIGAGETLAVDSLVKTITLTSTNGMRTNWFDKRSRENYIFEPIPAGRNVVAWSGAFGFDLTIIEERSEPRWI